MFLRLQMCLRCVHGIDFHLWFLINDTSSNAKVGDAIVLLQKLDFQAIVKCVIEYLTTNEFNCSTYQNAYFPVAKQERQHQQQLTQMNSILDRCDERERES